MISTSMDTVEIYTRCSAEFTRRLPAAAGNWAAPTELPGWDVRRLVHHMVEEELWAVPLFDGQTISEVGTRFDGELLGDDPIGACTRAAAHAVAAVAAPGALDRAVHLSFGDHPGHEYAWQLAADHLVHAVDLARALGIDETVDADAAAAIRDWFGPTEEVWRGIGVIGPRVDVPATAAPIVQLLGMMGRRS
jgi:uncharacterized protein (TIGR03086 family)